MFVSLRIYIYFQVGCGRSASFVFTCFSSTVVFCSVTWLARGGTIEEPRVLPLRGEV